MRLTPSKQSIYDAIKKFWHDYGYSPSLWDIADAVGLRSIATVSKHIDGLLAGGYLAKTEECPNGKRTLVPLPLGKGQWHACDARHRTVLYQGPMCPVCREKQATQLTMERVNGAKP